MADEDNILGGVAEEIPEEVVQGSPINEEAAGGRGGQEEIVISIEGEEPEEEEQKGPAPEWVKNLRKDYREIKQRYRELESKYKEVITPKEEALPAKPTLEGFDFDADKYEAALSDWFDRKRDHDKRQEEVKAAEAKAAESWQTKLSSYHKAKEEMPVDDFDEAEGMVTGALNATQQGIIVKIAKDPATFIYGIGKRESKLKELAAITDPIEFTAAVVDLEKKIVVQKRSAPPPEKVISGSGAKGGAVDSTLERLRAEAEKTGDYTKVVAYRNQLRNKA